MALPSSGSISLNQVNVELNKSGSTSIKMGNSDVRTLFARSSGSISMSHGHGKSNAAYVLATGGSITTSGSYKIHKFTGSGTFKVTNSGNAAGSNNVEYLVIGGGGPGGCYGGGAGGGAGGYRTSYSTQGGGCSAAANKVVSVTSYSVVVGAGGSFGSTYCPHPASWWPGSSSSALGIT